MVSMEKQNKCGVCAHYLAGGDFGLCCEKRYELCYETTPACEEFFEPIECAICDEQGGVILVKYPFIEKVEGKQIAFERWSYHCTKCGQTYEPAWMMNQNLGRMKWAYEQAK